ncbi:hypothetical protein FVEG_04294 [Fusarium verticillioides 7600]|uniref:Uncharacterized protein n=1 Tax=Gibberella moniliformis (strain M3125 / FGSC 7600) TaxID=334819 RepID=W7M4S3_GIBM7|nr:hypothetical protein FVEG_04294 [Fusarium verticillioides 7600]EWG42514.1 hypothetical protein FVEG_04294 [Fusarium verticillioides 7600]
MECLFSCFRFQLRSPLLRLVQRHSCFHLVVPTLIHRFLRSVVTAFPSPNALRGTITLF